MKYTFLIFILAGVACNNSKSDLKATDVSIEKKRTRSCYRGNVGKDTVSLELNLMNTSSVSGNLDYNFFEKDRNKGFISGQMKGDTLFADYKFMSEGTNSAREVAFLRKDGQLLEGYGNMIEKDGKMVFQDRSAIKFGDGFKLSESECGGARQQ